MTQGRVFVTGASGFVGSAVVHRLADLDYTVHALVHDEPVESHGGRVVPFEGGLFHGNALHRGMTGCSAVIHLVGIIREIGEHVTFQRIHVEATKQIVNTAKRLGIKRYVHMSALGARPDAESEYHKTKYEAEEYVRANAPGWTIFRPSLIHGPQGEFMQQMAAWARKAKAPWLFMPYFGGGAVGQKGAGELQPVYVGDVARAFVDAIRNDKTAQKVYPLVGPKRFTWPAMYRRVSEAILGRERMTAPIPVWYARLLTKITPASWLPFNEAQVIMSQEDNVADGSKFAEDFGWSPAEFEATLRTYARYL